MGITEIVVILIVAVVVFGPEQLPTLVKRITGLLRRFHAVKSEVSQQLDQAMLGEQLKDNEEKAATADEKYASKVS